MSSLKGKKVMVVNTASKCGLTYQYEILEKMYKDYESDNFIIVGFPANNFLWQEPGSNDEIAAYCIDIIPKSIFSDNIDKIDYKGSLFDLLAQNGHLVSHSESTLRPTMLTKRDFPEMKDSVGLFLLLEEIFFDISGIPVCYSNDYYSSNVFDFKIIRKRQLG